MNKTEIECVENILKIYLVTVFPFISTHDAKMPSTRGSLVPSSAEQEAR